MRTALIQCISLTIIGNKLAEVYRLSWVRKTASSKVLSASSSITIKFYMDAYKITITKITQMVRLFAYLERAMTLA